MSRIRFPAKITSAETELLIGLSRVRLDDARVERAARLIEKAIDWNYLLFAAAHHATLPLVYSHLAARFAQSIPADILRQFREQYQNNARYSLLLTNELLRVLGLFRSQGIEAIPFKGPMLALSAYQDLGLRQFVDIDLLIHKSDVSQVRRLLASNHYIPQFQLNMEEEADLLAFRCEDCFVRDDLCAIDLHWAIVPTHYDFAPDPEVYWQRTAQVSIGGSRVPTLAPEDLFLLLCVHGAKHSWKRLNWICDLAELIHANPAIDWLRLIKQARAEGSGRMLLLGLYLANDLFEEPLPEAVIAHLRKEPGLTSLAASVYRRLLRNPGKPPRFFEQDLFFLRSMVHLRDRVRLLASHFAPTPHEWKLLPLPRRLRFLYYAVRPLRLAVKFTGKLFIPSHSSRII